MATLFVDKIDPQSGTSLEIGSSGDTISVPTGASLTVPSGGLSGQNYPAFEAYQSATQTGVSDAVWTKMTMNTETFDTDGNYDNSSNYRFTPTTAGRYFVYVMGGCFSDTNYKLNVANIAIYKNGSYFRATNITVNGADILNEATTTTTAIIDMNGSSDYLEAYARVNVTTGTGSIDARAGVGGFGAYRIGS